MPAEIRTATTADGPAIADVRRTSWFAAYTGIIDAGLIDRVTVTGGRAADPPPYRRTLVATTPAEPRLVIGYASFGPERSVASAIQPPPPAAAGSAAHPPALVGELTPAGLAGEIGELYALYLTPAWWSTGTGRALLAEALAGLRAAGFRRAVLWTLTRNARARRFYERSGFAADGATNIITSLGDVEELRYVSDL